MPDLYSLLNLLLTPPYAYLTLGVILLSAGVVSTCAGKTFSGYGGWAHRAKEPAQFWWTVAIDYLGGTCLIGYFLCKVHAF
jgi:hypothetical protein